MNIPASDGWKRARLFAAPLALLLANAVYGWYIMATHERAANVDVFSLAMEAAVAFLPAVGLLVITGVRDVRKAYRPLLAGLALLTVSMVTDALDEVVNMRDFENMLFEGVFQVAGFLLLLIGLSRWVSHSTSLTASLERLATVDVLTGMANRRRFLATIGDEIARATRQRSTFAVILFDLDRFKQVNDRFGHDVGDAVLVAVTRLIHGHIRAIDTLARYGGEEFVLLLPGADLAGARVLAEKCRKLLDDNATPPAGATTASFGVAQYRSGDTVTQLLKRADLALYKAKAAGRNCVVADGEAAQPNIAQRAQVPS